MSSEDVNALRSPEIADHGTLFDQLSRRQKRQRHQRLQLKDSHHQFRFVLVLRGLLSSSVVQAVLTEDVIIDKELTWAAMARRKHQISFHLRAYDARGSTSKTWNDSDNGNRANDEIYDWTQEDHDRTREQREQDRIHLQLQHEEQLRRRQKISGRRRHAEVPSYRGNLRGRSDSRLLR
jgi:hypothetical protein